ncbi:MAG: hypothetical protein VW875_00250 [Planctomycetaceae bacterium]
MLTIDFSCSQCGHTMKLPVALIGKKGKCPKCGSMEEVTSPALSPSDFQIETVNTEPFSSLQSIRSKTKSNLIPKALICFSVLALITCVFVVIKSSSTTNPNAKTTDLVKSDELVGESISARGDAKSNGDNRPVRPTSREDRSANVISGESEGNNFELNFTIPENGFYSFEINSIPDGNFILVKLFKRQNNRFEEVGILTGGKVPIRFTKHFEAGEHLLQIPRAFGNRIMYKFAFNKRTLDDRLPSDNAQDIKTGVDDFNGIFPF